jgi:hypothetical protein
MVSQILPAKLESVYIEFVARSVFPTSKEQNTQPNLACENTVSGLPGCAGLQDAL